MYKQRNPLTIQGWKEHVHFVALIIVTRALILLTVSAGAGEIGEFLAPMCHVLYNSSHPKTSVQRCSFGFDF